MAGALWKVPQEAIHKHFLPKFHPKVKVLAMKGKETIYNNQFVSSTVFYIDQYNHFYTYYYTV
jgi:hypothetical protein